MDIQYREINTNDLEEISHLRMDFLREIAEKPIPNQLLENIQKYLDIHFHDGSCFGLVAIHENKIIAKGLICVYHVLPDEYAEDGCLGKLYSIYTLPMYRGKGIMKELIEKLIDLAKEKNVNNLYLAAEEKAIPLYQRLGFRMLDNEMKLDRREWMLEVENEVKTLSKKRIVEEGLLIV